MLLLRFERGCECDGAFEMVRFSATNQIHTLYILHWIVALLAECLQRLGVLILGCVGEAKEKKRRVLHPK